MLCEVMLKTVPGNFQDLRLNHLVWYPAPQVTVCSTGKQGHSALLQCVSKTWKHDKVDQTEGLMCGSSVANKVHRPRRSTEAQHSEVKAQVHAAAQRPCNPTLKQDASKPSWHACRAVGQSSARYPTPLGNSQCAVRAHQRANACTSLGFRV